MDHVCATCKFKKRPIANISVSNEDNAVFERIQNMISTAEQSCRPISIPEDTPSKLAAAYFQGATATLTETRLLLIDWWKDMISKYAIPESAKYDSITHTFYECVDDSGVASITGEWTAK